MTHHHDHDHQDHSCCCAHGGCGGGGGCCQSGGQTVPFTQQERAFLLTLLERQFLPMVQLVVKSSKTHEFEMVALSPVYLENASDSIPQVRERGDMLLKLEDMGLLTLDFEVPLDPLSYEIYEQSTVFSQLKEMVAEGQTRDGYLGDIPTIQQGSIAITQACYQQFSV